MAYLVGGGAGLLGGGPGLGGAGPPAGFTASSSMAGMVMSVLKRGATLLFSVGHADKDEVIDV